MTIRFPTMAHHLRSYIQNIVHHALFISAWMSWIGCVVVTIAHYSGFWYGNPWTWILWIISCAFFICSFLSRKRLLNGISTCIRQKPLMIIVFVSLLFFITHVRHWSSSPWNNYGLFDDAAWDIYFANTHIGHSPFQAVFFDTVGYISRETVFHYYITFFFQLFGYNLFVFNCALLFLGYITVLGTTLIIDRLCKNTAVTLCSAVILNFFPLQFLHIFMGHRYAIAAPLMVLSLYFLYTAFLTKSNLRSAVSAFFGALCWGSAVTGKQYIYGLFIGGVLLLLSKKQRGECAQYRNIILTWLMSFLIGMTPVYIYIVFHASTYAIREQELLREFLVTVQQQGMNRFTIYANQLLEVFTARSTIRRQFLVDYPLIPYAYYVLLIPSMVVTWIKRRYELVILAVLPIIVSFISGAYDFRILITVPVWVIIMAYGMKEMARHTYLRMLIFMSVFIGLVSTSTYLWNVSKNPHAQYLLPHKDVAVSRLVQDIVIGAEHPSIQMKQNEFRIGQQVQSNVYDVLVCPASAYAIMHVFLQAYDDKKILSFCDQGIMQLKTADEILRDNIRAIVTYQPTKKDLKLIWESTDTAQLALATFSRIAPHGRTDVISETIEGIPFSVYILTIPQTTIAQFQSDVSHLQ